MKNSVKEKKKTAQARANGEIRSAPAATRRDDQNDVVGGSPREY